MESSGHGGWPDSPTNLSSSQHLQLPESLLQLHQEYGKRLKIAVVDNSGATANELPIEKLDSLRYTKGEEALLNEQQSILDRLRDEGKLSPAIHEKLSRSGAVQPQDRESGNRGVERSRSQGEGKRSSPLEPSFELQHPPADIGVKQFVATLPEKLQGYTKDFYNALLDHGAYDTDGYETSREALGMNPESPEYNLDDNEEVADLEDDLRRLGV
ncbi:MAG TPA: hypothetical protein VMI06_13505 [Terriglobia bacterium]|nr:hypothetical protein [Terriglobia bacterium]